MSIEADNLLELVKLAVFGRLDADSFFSTVPVVYENEGELEKEVEIALGGIKSKGGKKGAMVCVHGVDISGLEGEHLGQVKLSVLVEVGEVTDKNRSTLGTGKTAAEMAARVLQCLHCWDCGYGTLYAEANPVTELSLIKGQVGFALEFSVWCGFGTSEKVAAITASGSEELTLTCSTPGAQIYYTTDGTLPTPTNGTAYTVPITATAGLELRACAYRSDRAASDVLVVTTAEAVVLIAEGGDSMVTEDEEDEIVEEN